MDPTHVSLAPLMQLLLAFATPVIAGIATLIAGKLVLVLRDRFHIECTNQQVKAVHDAADTAAGVITADLYSGAMTVQDVHISNPQVRDLAQIAANMVPKAAAALGVSPTDLAHIIVGRVGKMMSADPTMNPTVTAASPLLAATA